MISLRGPSLITVLECTCKKPHLCGLGILPVLELTRSTRPADWGWSCDCARPMSMVWLLLLGISAVGGRPALSTAPGDQVTGSYPKKYWMKSGNKKLQNALQKRYAQGPSA